MTTEQQTTTETRTLAKKRFCVAIPTYKRPHLVQLLIEDILQQTRLPEQLTIIDGDPASGEVRAMLDSLVYPSGVKVLYVPSNRGNLSYQRYLGWRTTQPQAQMPEPMGCEVLLYFDDDLRIAQPDAIERVLAPFDWADTTVVGVTAPTITGDLSKFEGAEAMLDRGNRQGQWLVRLFGASRTMPPGGMTPVGHRRQPTLDGSDYVQTTWLQGRVMAYDLQALQQDCFSADLFALDHVRCGLGEDTFLSRRVGTRGDLMMAVAAEISHPDEDLPKSYPYQARKYGYATAYSRRFLNDHYRDFDAPTLADRLALGKSYLGNMMLSWGQAIATRRQHRLAYAWGFTMGALRGVFQKPTADNLTPDIDWWADAEVALAATQVVHEP